MLQGNNKIIYPKLLTNKQASHIHKGLIISMVMDIYKPLSWSHIAHPIAATEEWDGQQSDFQGTKANNGVLAQALRQTCQISPW